MTIGCTSLPVCGEPGRRTLLRRAGTLNGIDYIEVGADQLTLCVHLFGDVPESIGVASVRIRGGRRIRDLRVLHVAPDREADMQDDPCLRVVLDRAGDFSAYCLCLVQPDAPADPEAWTPYEGFDPRYACAELRFRLDCPQPLDCDVPPAPCIETRPAPAIDYLAKDYTSFRQLLFDRMAQTMPAWRERHVPDIGVALVELLAYRADRLSYFQDAVATEAYLDTARRRISVRRHARLVDYRLHEGCNARALVALDSDTDVVLPLDGLRFAVPPPGETPVVPGLVSAERLDEARGRGAIVFEPVALDGRTTLDVVAAHSTIRIYTWGDELCCLPRGTTRATLLDDGGSAAPDDPAGPVDARPRRADATHDAVGCGPETESLDERRVLRLAPGDLLVFEEVLGPRTGNTAEPDPARRHAVRLTTVERSEDPLLGRALLEVAWDECDALPFDLCLSVRLPAPDCRPIGDVSVARGNVVLVDHGEHICVACPCDELCAETSDGAGHDGAPSPTPAIARVLALVPDACQRCRALGEECWIVPGTDEPDCCRCEGAVSDRVRTPARIARPLQGTPITFAAPIPAGVPVCELLDQDPRAALPQVVVHGGPLDEVLLPAVPDRRWRWEPRADLLASGPDDRHVVVEIDDDGAATLRFGDGALGREPLAGDFFRVRVRVGNGAAGNVGRDSITWIAPPPGALSGVTLVPRNPLPARGGTAPEPIAEAKLFAPSAFRARALRAITADDYAAFAARAPGVQGAGCALEWTGSWYEANVVIDPTGGATLPPSLAGDVAGRLHRYRRIGHDVAVEPARYVPLTIAMTVCVLPDYLTAHVEAALCERFGTRPRRDGALGFFHPDRLRLGESVYLSRLVAEAQSIVGVAHVEVTRLARADDPENTDALTTGVLAIGPRELARVDDDPDFPEHGTIDFDMEGGR